MKKGFSWENLLFWFVMIFAAALLALGLYTQIKYDII